MKRSKLLIGIICLVTAAWGCKKVTDLQQSTSSVTPTGLKVNTTTPHVVQVVNQSGTWKMLVDGASYFIEGGAISNRIPNRYWFNMFAYGGSSGHANSIRIYTVDDHTQSILDSAQIHGQTVTLCLSAKHPADDPTFYTDTAKVNAQYRAFKSWVIRYKDHPALLMWAIGNELNSAYSTVPNHLLCWDAVSNISTMIHTLDPNHPTSTIIAGSSPTVLNEVNAGAPHLNCIGINEYGSNITTTNQHVLSSNINIPYYFGEFGPDGTWFQSVPKTSFGSLIEKSSTDKADDYLYYYSNYIGPNKLHGCLGSYAFLWGYLPEKNGGSTLGSQTFVPTWFGMRSFDNYAFGALEALQKAWTGSYPTNRAPQIAATEMKWGTYTKANNIIVSPSTKLLALITATDPDGDPMTYEWSVVQEGAPIKAPASVFSSDSKSYPSVLNQTSVPRAAGPKDTITITAPVSPGNYRLYGFVKDNNNHIASACLPFKVQ